MDFPVRCFLARFERFHSASEIYDLLASSLDPGRGVSVHEVNQFPDGSFRICFSSPPRDFASNENMIRTMLTRSLVDEARDVSISTEVPSVARETGKGILNDLSGLLKGAGQTVGDTVKGVSGGFGLGTLALVGVVLAVGVFLVVKTRGASA